MTYNYRTPAWVVAILLSHLTSPLAILWYKLTGDDLTIHVGTFTYRITARHVSESGGAYFGGFTIQLKPGARPRNFHYSSSGNRVRIFEPKVVKLFPRCRDGALLSYQSAGSISHSVGPIDIDLSRCDPKQPSVPRRRSLSELVKSAKIPVFGPAGSPSGLRLVSKTTSQGIHEVHTVTLLFANSPSTNKDPGRTEEYLDQVRTQLFRLAHEWPEEMVQSFNRELKRKGIDSTYDQMFNRSTPPELPARPPVPTVALELTSGLVDPVLEEKTEEAQEWALQQIVETDPFATTLFKNLPAEIRKQLSDYECKLLCSGDNYLLQSYAPDLVDRIAASGARAIRRPFTIDGLQFDGRMLYWPHTTPLCAFDLTLAQAEDRPTAFHLNGAMLGLEQDEVLSLLENLVRIGERPELLEEYRTQLAEHKEQQHFYWDAVAAAYKSQSQ